MIIRKLRLQQGWSQEQLSQCSGLSIRTISRIERGQNASVESLKSLAAVFEVQITDLTQESGMNEDTVKPQPTKQAIITKEEEAAINQVKEIKGFYSHLMTYVCVIMGMFLMNLYTDPNSMWFLWTAFFWGLGIVSHALSAFEVFNFFSPEWEKKQIEKRLGRKL